QSIRKLLSVDFEVFGKVQGVYFRKYTQLRGTELGLVGWCMNTAKGTVTGIMQGSEDKIAEMKKWLQETGSPASVIDHAVFSNEHEIEKPSFSDFQIHYE
ncbi:hypothetical protein WA538_003503, partial [Blastocystis sp. DL]